jgi:hypothetical protein
MTLCTVAAAAGCSGAGVGASGEDLSSTGEAVTSNVIGGTITNSSGKGIAGAKVTIQGTGVATATTNASGQYTFTGLASTSHTITATLSNCTFSPGVANGIWPGATQNFTGSGSGCSGVAGTGTGTVAPCPTKDANDSEERAAATVAFNLMRGAAKMGGAVAPAYSNTILAPQRYRIPSTGVGIEFDPTDPLYSYVSNDMKATLALAQLDTTVAQFLQDGLNYAYTTTNGTQFPSVEAIAVLANFSYPTSTTVHIADNQSSNNSHQATVSGEPWCGAQMITILDTVQDSYSFSPLYAATITNPGISVGGGWLTKPPAAFKGSSNRPMTPFNGPSSSGNPYLVISVNGTATNWGSYNFSPVSCYTNPSPFECSGTLQIDPIPYAEPGSYYDTTGNLVGTQANPFAIAGSLYAVAAHQSQWATRTVNGVQEWGTFATPVTILGTTQYKYVKQM